MPAPSSGQAVGTGLSNVIPVSSNPVPCTAFVMKAPLTNTAAVYVGPSTVSSSNGHQMDPGDEYTYERVVQNGQPSYQLAPSDFFMVGGSGDKVTWLASP